MPCFTELYSMFYFNKKKILPQNIYDNFTPVALAHWVMGSGIKLQGRGLRLCAYSFSIPEVVTLMNVLIIKYRLVCTLQLDKDKPVIFPVNLWSPCYHSLEALYNFKNVV